MGPSAEDLQAGHVTRTPTFQCSRLCSIERSVLDAHDESAACRTPTMWTTGALADS